MSKLSLRSRSVLSADQISEIYREIASRELQRMLIRIDALKGEVEAGTYQFDVELAAIRMLSDLSSL